MQSELRRRGVSLETRLTGSLELIKGDRTQLQQVIVNLIMNATEAMDTFPTSARILRVVSEFDEKGDVFTSIEDTGPGIETGLLERIFDPMFTTKPAGLGLGLSICQSIIDGHGGRLWVVPNPIGGSIFRFSLPSITRVSHDATT
jgi:signal transduction histidine kinase